MLHCQTLKFEKHNSASEQRHMEKAVKTLSYTHSTSTTCDTQDKDPVNQLSSNCLLDLLLRDRPCQLFAAGKVVVIALHQDGTRGYLKTQSLSEVR